MSSILKKKAKKMEPAGYSKTELLRMRDTAKHKHGREELIEEAFKNVRLITYRILHDKYGFGLRRIIRLEETINAYLNSVAEGEVTIDGISFCMEEKFNINVKDEANKIPFNERFSLTHLRIDAKLKPSAGMYILSAIYDYLVLLGMCLKTQFNFSKPKILDVYNWIRDYINTLSRPEQFDLHISDIAQCLLDEINYCDERLLKKVK